eukprot:SAG22_NODE_3474_length_1690_cov_1.503457_3_plen_168_part_00
MSSFLSCECEHNDFVSVQAALATVQTHCIASILCHLSLSTDARMRGSGRIEQLCRNDWCDDDSAQELFDRHPDLSRHPDSPGELQEDGTIVGGCPNWQDPRSNPVKINRQTLGWNGAACFAYGFGKLALEGFKFVGDDQLIGGPVSRPVIGTISAGQQLSGQCPCAS